MDRRHWAGPELLWDAFATPNQGNPHLPTWQSASSIGHKKFESTVRYLGIEVDDALAISEQVEV